MIINDTVKYEVGDQTHLSQFFYDDAIEGPRPGVLVFPHARGIGGHDLEVSDKLARMGYAALACDLHGDALECPTLESVFDILKIIRADPSIVTNRVKAGLDALLKQPQVDPTRLAAMGYCIGGGMSCDAARLNPNVKAVVAFHGLTSTIPKVERAQMRIAGKVLACLGSDDPHVPLAQRIEFEEEMRAGPVDFRIVLYGGVLHGFSTKGIEQFGDPRGNHYDARADAHSWRETTELLADVF